MSSSQRRFLNSLDPVTDWAEISIFYKERFRKPVPYWLDEGRAPNVELIRYYREADTVLPACRAVLALGLSQGQSALEITKAQDLLTLFHNGVEALLEMPTKAPKKQFRDKLKEMYFEAWEILDKQIEQGLRLKDFYQF